MEPRGSNLNPKSSDVGQMRGRRRAAMERHSTVEQEVTTELDEMARILIVIPCDFRQQRRHPPNAGSRKEDRREAYSVGRPHPARGCQGRLPDSVWRLEDSPQGFPQEDASTHSATASEVTGKLSPRAQQPNTYEREEAVERWKSCEARGDNLGERV